MIETARAGARRSVLAGLLLFFITGAARAVVPAPDAGVFALADRAAATAGAVAFTGKVADVDREDDRVEIARIRVRSAIEGDPGTRTVRVAHRRLFARDPSPFEKGRLVLIFAEPLPDQTYWNKRFPKPEGVLHLAAARYRVELAPGDETAYVDVLRRYRELRRAGAPGEQVADLLLKTAREGPAALGADAMRALGPELGRMRAIGTERWRAVDAWVRDVARDEGAKRAFVASLGEAGVHGAVDWLLALERDLPALRRDAVAALGRLGHAPRAEQGRADVRRALLAHADRWLADPDPAVRRAAVPILGAVGEPASTARLGALGVGDADDEVASAAVEQLADLARDEPAAYPALGEIVRKGRDLPALRAITALGRLGTAPAAEELGRSFDGDRPRLHIATVVALANMNQPGARAVVDRVRREHPDSRVRAAIERVLGARHP